MNKEIKARLDELEKQFKEIKAQMKELEKKEEFKYPIYALSTNGIIVKFESLSSGTIFNGNGFYKIGQKSNFFIPHNRTEHWQILPVCEERWFYHGQPVWACDDNFLCVRSLRFYDAINSTTFGNNGESGFGGSNNSYEPWEGEWLPWMLESFKKLEL